MWKVEVVVSFLLVQTTTTASELSKGLSRCFGDCVVVVVHCGSAGRRQVSRLFEERANSFGVQLSDGAYVYAFGVAWTVGPLEGYGVHD